MDTRTRQRSVYVTSNQKKKLIELMVKHPELISCKVTQDFNYRDSQKLWHNIANECNALPGARKTWRQWRKTWQDIRSKTKKQQVIHGGEVSTSLTMLSLSSAEQEVLGLKNVSSTTNQDTTEFIPLEAERSDDFDNDIDSNVSYSEPESPKEDKVFTKSQNKAKKVKNKNHNEHLDCIFNCDRLSIQEERKLQIKEDYFNFKKDYLKQKLVLLKEQTEALKSIAKELCK